MMNNKIRMYYIYGMDILRRIFVSIWPWFNGLYEGSFFVFVVLYFCQMTEHSSPWLYLQHLVLRRLTQQDYFEQSKNIFIRRNATVHHYLHQVGGMYGTLLAFLLRLGFTFQDYSRHLLLLFLFVFKFLEWWYATEEERMQSAAQQNPFLMSASTNNGGAGGINALLATFPPPPPPKRPLFSTTTTTNTTNTNTSSSSSSNNNSSMSQSAATTSILGNRIPAIPLPSDYKRCPICLKVRSNPTVLTLSGYVFCHQCILDHVRQHHYCPITLLPASEYHLRRIYP